MKQPQSVSDLRRFMGLVNQLGKFSSRIAEISQPVRELLRSNQAWIWGPDQEKSFSKIKQELTKPAVLALYNPQAETKVSADASSFGLGAVLLQLNDQSWKHVTYTSRSLTDMERRYAQIEKEALSTTWACKKFSTYILGQPFLVESDHKPLVQLLNTKHLDDLPPWVLRFRLRLAKYDYAAHHIPGNPCMQLMHYHMLQAGRKEIKNFKKKWRLMSTMSLCLPYHQHLRGCSFISWLKFKILNARGLESTVKLNGQGNTPWRIH